MGYPTQGTTGTGSIALHCNLLPDFLLHKKGPNPLALNPGNHCSSPHPGRAAPVRCATLCSLHRQHCAPSVPSCHRCKTTPRPHVLSPCALHLTHLAWGSVSDAHHQHYAPPVPPIAFFVPLPMKEARSAPFPAMLPSLCPRSLAHLLHYPTPPIHTPHRCAAPM